VCSLDIGVSWWSVRIISVFEQLVSPDWFSRSAVEWGASSGALIGLDKVFLFTLCALAAYNKEGYPSLSLPFTLPFVPRPPAN
jgi:hypothetical protein